MFTEEMQDREWFRLRAYSAFVQVLTANTADIHASTWLYVEQFTRDRPMLPHIRKLRWSPGSPQYASELPLLVGPFLTSLEIDYKKYLRVKFPPDPWWDLSFRMLLSSALSIATQLKHFSLRAKDARLSSVFVEKFKAITSFHVDTPDFPVSSETLRVLSSLPHLERLELYGIPSHTAIGRGFLSLRELELHTMPSHNGFFDAFSSNLRNLLIDNYPSTHAQEFESSCHTWARCFPSLERLECDTEGIHEDDPDAPPATLSAFITPLLALSSITVFRLTSHPHGFSVNDADAAALARWWPRIVELVLYTRGVNDVSEEEPLHEMVTSAALVTLARACPELRILALPGLCVAEDELSPTKISEVPLLAHGLEKLDLGRVIVADASMCALLLDRIFPQLDVSEEEYLGPALQRLDDVSQEWLPVKLALAAFRLASRQNEERRKCQGKGP